MTYLLGIALWTVVGLCVWFTFRFQLWRYPLIRFHGWMNRLAYWINTRSDDFYIIIYLVLPFVCAMIVFAMMVYLFVEWRNI